MPLWFYSDLGSVTITYQDHQEATASASSHTFTAMAIGAADTTKFVIAAFSWRDTSLQTVSSVTIGGATATQLGSTAGPASGGRHIAAFIAAVPTGTTADVIVNLSGTGIDWACTTNTIYGISSLTPASTATSTANNPTASMSCNANGVIFGCAVAGGLSSPSATWSGITEDSDRNYGGSNLLCFTSAHSNFTTAQSGLTCTCTFSTTAASAGVFASFNP